METKTNDGYLFVCVGAGVRARVCVCARVFGGATTTPHYLSRNRGANRHFSSSISSYKLYMSYSYGFGIFGHFRLQTDIVHHPIQCRLPMFSNLP